MYGIIYKATSPDGRVYIGQTVKTLQERKRGHKYQALKQDHRSSFQIAILEQGFSNFTWEQIDTANAAEELDRKEKQWIAHYKSTDPQYGYNNTDGGLKTVYSPESRRKISKAKTGQRHTEASRQKMSKSHIGLQAGEKHPLYGKHHTAESNRKNSEAHKGNKNRLGKRHTPESRKKMSEALKGEKHPMHGKHLMAKLTEAQVREIKIALANGEKGTSLAKKYGVSKNTIYSIKYGKSWKNVGGAQ